MNIPLKIVVAAGAITVSVHAYSANHSDSHQVSINVPKVLMIEAEEPNDGIRLRYDPNTSQQPIVLTPQPLDIAITSNVDTARLCAQASVTNIQEGIKKQLSNYNLSVTLKGSGQKFTQEKVLLDNVIELAQIGQFASGRLGNSSEHVSIESQFTGSSQQVPQGDYRLDITYTLTESNCG